MIFRDLYKVARCATWRVSVGKHVYEYGIFSKETENRPYITDIFSYVVVEILVPTEQTIFCKIKEKKECFPLK